MENKSKLENLLSELNIVGADTIIPNLSEDEAKTAIEYIENNVPTSPEQRTIDSFTINGTTVVLTFK